jgi:hypothetical protein
VPKLEVGVTRSSGNTDPRRGRNSGEKGNQDHPTTRSAPAGQRAVGRTISTKRPARRDIHAKETSMLQQSISEVSVSFASQALRHDIIPYATMMLDASFRIASCGAAAATLFGHAARALIGMPVSVVLPALSALSSSGSADRERPVSVRMSKIEMDAVHADGAHFPVLVSVLEEHDSPSQERLLFVRNLSAYN